MRGEKDWEERGSVNWLRDYNASGGRGRGGGPLASIISHCDDSRVSSHTWEEWTQQINVGEARLLATGLPPHRPLLDPTRLGASDLRCTSVMGHERSSSISTEL